MTTTEDLERLSRVASETCQRLTGSPLPLPDVARWPSVVESEDAFRHVVSRAYVWLHEDWAPHTSFFRSSAAAAVGLTTAQLRLTDANVNALRTSHEHSLDPSHPRDARTLRETARWMRDACGTEVPASAVEWGACGHALFGELESALREFIGIARAVEGHPDLSEQWRWCFAATEIDLIAVRQEIAGDLGILLRGAAADYVDLRISRSWERAVARSSREDASALVRRIVVRELVAWSTPELPLDLDELLTRLDLDPGRDALGAVRLVHAISEAVEFDGTEELLEVTAHLWARLVARDWA